MSELKIVLYKDNLHPRHIALNTRLIYQIIIIASVLSIFLLITSALTIKYYLFNHTKISQSTATQDLLQDNQPRSSSSLEEQNITLRDHVEQLNLKLRNATLIQSAPQQIDKTNPALALFPPIITDKTKDQDQVLISNLTLTKNTSSNIVNFELHNKHPGTTVQKGYLVVLGKNQDSLYSYPNIFEPTGPYLLNFEKGETFQVTRFRLVNAPFAKDIKQFQILIFTRKGELLVNKFYEANTNESKSN